MSEDVLIPVDRPPDVSIVIPTYNHAALTAQCLASIARTCRLSYELIIVDNGSTDETLSIALSHTPGQLRGAAQGDNPPAAVRVVHNTVPRLVARSWNLGVDAARARIVLITNNDVVFTVGAIDAMVRLACNEPQAGVVVPVSPQDIPRPPALVHPEQTETPVATMMNNLDVVEKFGRSLRTGASKVLSSPCVRAGGFCFAARRKVFDAVGGFDERYTLTGEDWDWFHRVQAHYKLLQADVYVAHYEHATCHDLGADYEENLWRNRFLLTECLEGLRETFSVVIPTYNRTEALLTAIGSVIDQTCRDWRLYVVDDGSPNWPAIRNLLISRLKLSGQGDTLWSNQICVLHLETNAGPGAARNHAIRYSRGKYVAFLDSDDIWYPGHLATHLKTHETNLWAAVYSDAEYARRRWVAGLQTYIHQAAPHPTIAYRDEFDRDRLINENYIQTSALSVWGDLARATPWREDIRVREDWEWLKALAGPAPGRPIRHVPLPTARYHGVLSPVEEDHLMRELLPQFGGGEPDPPGFVVEGRKVDSDIGVVIPTRDRPDRLTRALASVGPDHRIAVIDDASANATAVLHAVRAVPTASLWRYPRPHGPSCCRNRAIELLDTEWIQFLDDDDQLLADWAGRLRPHLRGDVDVVVASALVPAGHSMTPDTDVFTSQICARRSALFAVGAFAEGLQWAEERDMLERMRRQGLQVVTIALPTVIRPARGNSGQQPAAAPPTGTIHRSTRF